MNYTDFKSCEKFLVPGDVRCQYELFGALSQRLPAIHAKPSLQTRIANKQLERLTEHKLPPIHFFWNRIRKHGRGERYDGTNSRTGPLRPKKTEKKI